MLFVAVKSILYSMRYLEDLTILGNQQISVRFFV